MKRIASIIGVIILGLAGGMLATGIATAARNSSGTYQPYASPFVPHQTIASSSFNGWFSDVGTEITDSLSRSGKGGMLSPLRVPDGSNTTPSLSFTNATGTGFYRQGTGEIAIAFSGARKAYFDTSGNLFSNGILTNANGVATSVQGNSANSGGAVGVVVDNTAALAAAGSKLLSIRNAGVEEAYFRYDGTAFLSAGLTTGTVAPFSAGDIRLQRGSAPTTGAIHFGDNASAHYVYWDGTRFSFGAGPDPVTVGTPVNAGDAATKSYVDTLADGQPSISMGSNWTNTNNRLWKGANGLTVLNVVSTAGSGAATTALTIPVGYRPGMGIDGVGWDATANGAVLGILAATGALTTGSPINGHVYFWTFTYKAEN